MGDPAGIGPELVLKAWLERNTQNLPCFIYLGDPDDLAKRADTIGITAPIKILPEGRSFPERLSEATTAFDNALPVVPLKLAKPSIPGRLDASNASQIIAAITDSVEFVKHDAARAIVTNPIHKSCLYDAGFAFPGHTEFLAHLASQWQLPSGKNPTRSVMMLASDEMKVVPATIHIPLKDVPGKLSIDLLIETGKIVARDLEKRFTLGRPRIAFAGLNPHAGESGAMGTEEETIILPAIQELVAQGVRATGPFPADTLFHERARHNYDAVIAMYHDQALVPIKTVAFDRAVNVTLGLPFVRTSPDHGTALDIAGTGQASPSSLIAAIKMADTMTKAPSP